MNDDPIPLSQSLIKMITEFPPGHHLHDIGVAISDAGDTCRKRRAAALKHADLRTRLKSELGYDRPEQWNGWIPPARINPDSTNELLHSSVSGLPNSKGLRTDPEYVNESPRRTALIQISAEAWAREHPS